MKAAILSQEQGYNCHQHLCKSQAAQAPAQCAEGSYSNGQVLPTNSIWTELPRRNAATQATQKLRDIIMRDMNSFEQLMKKSRKSGGGVTGMEWDDREMRETSVGKRKRASEVRSDQMDIDGEREEEEDTGREKKHVKISAGPVGRGKGRAVSSDREEKERSCKSSVMSKGTSKRKQAEHVEDEDASGV